MSAVARWVGVCFVLNGMVGCVRSTPSRFYTLVPTIVNDGPPAKAESTVVLGSIVLPAYLSTLQMVQRVGDSEVTLENNERWAEDLKAGFERTLTADLSKFLGQQAVFLYQAPVGSDARYRIDVVVDRFEVGLNGAAVLDARWWVTDGNLRAVGSAKTSSISEASDSASWESRAAALSRAVGSLARTMAESLPSRS